MKWLDKFRPKAASLTEPEWWKAMGATRMATGSGVAVTAETAMNVSAVYAAVRILSETIASLPLKIYESKNGTRDIANHPLNHLLGASPNGEQTAMELREFQMTCLGLRGNAYSQVIRNNAGTVVEINPLNAAFMRVDRSASGDLVFDYSETGNSRVYTAREIWRIAGLSLNGVLGVSPIAMAKESIGTSIATESHASRIFSNGATTSMVLEFDKTLTADQIQNLRTQFADNYSGHKNAHKPMILESGMKASNIGMTADDSQFLESRKFQIAEIARWYRVPLHMLAEMDSATFSNIEHQSIDFVVHTIRPWLVRIEQSIARDLLTVNERSRLHASHTVEGLLRGDTATRYEAYGKAIKDGWQTRNGVRLLENLNPAPGLDEFILPLNMSTVSEREKQMSAAAAKMLANREVAALNVEAKRLTVAEFAAWLPDFYNRQAVVIADALAIDEDLARTYTTARLAHIATLTDPAQAADGNLTEQLEALAHE